MSSTDPLPASPKPRGRHPGNRHAARYPEKTVRVSCRLPASLHAALTCEAEDASKPLSQLIVEKLAAF